MTRLFTEVLDEYLEAKEDAFDEEEFEERVTIETRYRLGKLAKELNEIVQPSGLDK